MAIGAIGRLFRRAHHDERAMLLYNALVAQARQPGFYRDCGVPDTLDGRFEMIALHAFLVIRRLREKGLDSLAQALFDLMFDDMDRSLRELGAGDLGVGRRVKAMARGFYGRIAAYDAGLAGDDAALAAALCRNVYGTVEPDDTAVAAMVAYLRREALALAGAAGAGLAAGEVAFGPAAAGLAAVPAGGDGR